MVEQEMGMKMERKKALLKAVALIVDDDEQIVRMMKRRMISYFDEVITCTTPQSVTETLRDRPITHLICDYHLGDATGSLEETGFKLDCGAHPPNNIADRVTLRIPGTSHLFFMKYLLLTLHIAFEYILFYNANREAQKLDVQPPVLFKPSLGSL